MCLLGFYIAEDGILLRHRRENLISYKELSCLCWLGHSWRQIARLKMGGTPESDREATDI
jgi:hypothetical protein